MIEDYFIYINQLKEDYEKKTGLDPTHIIIGTEEFYKMENNVALIERLKYVKDTVCQGVVGNYIAGLKVIKTRSIKGIMIVANIP